MASIYFVGYKGKSLVERFIAWYTNGEYSHIEELRNLESLEGFGARDDGVGMYYGNKPGTEYTVWELICTADQKKKFTQFKNMQIGKPYDFLGLLGFFIRRDVNEDSKWFCSELEAVACKNAGIRLFSWEHLEAGLVSPNVFVLSPMLKKISDCTT